MLLCMMDPIKVALFTVVAMSVLVEGDGVKLIEKQIVYNLLPMWLRNLSIQMVGCQFMYIPT